MSETIRRIRPTPSDAYLANPHKGCCTFQRFNGDTLFPGTGWSEEGPVEFPPGSKDVTAGYLPTTVSYCRWFWPVLEPKQGQYDFSVVDKSLEACKQRGQTLAVRLMSYGAARQPQVPAWYSSKYPMVDYDFWGKTMHIPVHDSPEYFEQWGNLIKEFGRRYDGHPLMESVDIAFIGPWGEGAGDCSRQTCEKFAELWRKAFARTPRLALVEGPQLKAGVDSGAGWRCDCFGDLNATGTAEIPGHLAWNHTFDAYPFAIAKAGAQDAWRTAPIHLETCWVPMYWHRQNFDIDLIIQQGLKMHATYFMPKSTRMPEPWLEKIAAFCRVLGYRYIYRQAVVDTVVSRGGKFLFKSWIENVGVAPIYRRYDFALRFRQGDVSRIVTLKDVDILKWMPGDNCIDTLIELPGGLQSGPVDLSAGLIDPGSQEARVRFAVKESFSDRWMPLTTLYVK